MYEQNSKWDVFYQELDPEKRKRLLNELAEPDDKVDKFRKQIFQKRYTNPKDAKHPWDLFLLQCAFLPSLYRKRKFFMTNMKKEMARTSADLCLDKVSSYTEEEKSALYWEIYNAACRYFKTCRGSKYGSRMLGISKADDNQKQILAARDAWQMTYGLARSEKMGSEYALFCEAVKRAFLKSYEDGEELFAHAEQKGLKEENK